MKTINAPEIITAAAPNKPEEFQVEINCVCQIPPLTCSENVGHCEVSTIVRQVPSDWRTKKCRDAPQECQQPESIVEFVRPENVGDDAGGDGWQRGDGEAHHGGDGEERGVGVVAES